MGKFRFTKILNVDLVVVFVVAVCLQDHVGELVAFIGTGSERGAGVLPRVRESPLFRKFTFPRQRGRSLADNNTELGMIGRNPDAAPASTVPVACYTTQGDRRAIVCWTARVFVWPMSIKLDRCRELMASALEEIAAERRSAGKWRIHLMIPVTVVAR